MYSDAKKKTDHNDYNQSEPGDMEIEDWSNLRESFPELGVLEKNRDGTPFLYQVAPDLHQFESPGFRGVAGDHSPHISESFQTPVGLMEFEDAFGRVGTFEVAPTTGIDNPKCLINSDDLFDLDEIPASTTLEEDNVPDPIPWAPGPLSSDTVIDNPKCLINSDDPFDFDEIPASTTLEEDNVPDPIPSAPGPLSSAPDPTRRFGGNLSRHPFMRAIAAVLASDGD